MVQLNYSIKQFMKFRLIEIELNIEKYTIIIVRLCIFFDYNETFNL